MLSEIVNRRSIRSYRPKPVSKEDIETILQAGALAPSSKNRQPWRFTVATGTEKAAALAVMARGLAEEIRRLSLSRTLWAGTQGKRGPQTNGSSSFATPNPWERAWKT